MTKNEIAVLVNKKNLCILTKKTWIMIKNMDDLHLSEPCLFFFKK